MKSLTPRELKLLYQTLEQLQKDVTIVYFTEQANCRHCRQERELLAEVADLSPEIHLEVHNFAAARGAAEKYRIDKVPALAIVGQKDYGVRYYGIPSDFEFRMLLEDILRISLGESGLSPGAKDRIRSRSIPLHIEVLTTPGCTLSARAMMFAHQMAMESDMITADIVNLEDFPELADGYNIMASPSVVVNGISSFYGVLGETEFVEQVFKAAEGVGR